MECENGQFKLDAVGDSGHAFGLCQVNDRWHKDIPENYTKDWRVAVEYCYQKFKDWTIFYWPKRIIEGQRCYEYIKNRYTFIE